jgi:hypothetical protein
MASTATPEGGALLLEAADLGRLFAALRDAGYRVIGPTVRDGAIILDELGSADDLPFGWGVSLEPGGYRIRRRDDGAAFGQAGPQSWKQFLHPPREKVWSARRTPDGMEVEAGQEPAPRLAFFGVRPCDLRAIQIQDQVLGRGEHAGSRYAARRAGVFIVAVKRQAALHDVAMITGEFHGARIAQEVGRVEHVHVQRVAGDPLAAVQQAPQVSEGTWQRDPARSSIAWHALVW